MNPESTTQTAPISQTPPVVTTTPPVAPVAPVVPPAPTAQPAAAAPVTLKYAGFWIRFIASMVDGVILIIPSILIQIIVDGPIGNILYFILTYLYFILMTEHKGATLGKMFVGLTVKSDDLQKLSIGKIILRETVGKWISAIILGIGYYMVGFTAKKQGLHDMMAHSVVVYKDPSKKYTARIVIATIIAVVLPALIFLGIMASVVLVSLDTARTKNNQTVTSTSVNEINFPFDTNSMMTPQ